MEIFRKICKYITKLFPLWVVLFALVAFFILPRSRDLGDGLHTC